MEHFGTVSRNLTEQHLIIRSLNLVVGECGSCTAHGVIIFEFIQTRLHIFIILDMADVCFSAVFQFISHYFAYNKYSLYISRLRRLPFIYSLCLSTAFNIYF